MRLKQTHRHCADVQFKRRSTDQTAFNLRLFIAAAAAAVVAGIPVPFSTLDEEHSTLKSDVGLDGTQKHSQVLSFNLFFYLFT